MGHVWRGDGKLMKRIISEEMESMRPQDAPKMVDNVRETMMELTQLREVE